MVIMICAMGLTHVSFLTAVCETDVLWSRRCARKVPWIDSSSLMSSYVKCMTSAPYNAATTAMLDQRVRPFSIRLKTFLVKPRISTAWLLNIWLQAFVASPKIPDAELVVTCNPRYLYFDVQLLYPSQAFHHQKIKGMFQV